MCGKIGQTAEGIRDARPVLQQAASYLSVLIDSDTDILHTECEIVCVRFVEDGRLVIRLISQQILAYQLLHDFSLILNLVCLCVCKFSTVN